jgi:hypothetical protein
MLLTAWTEEKRREGGLVVWEIHGWRRRLLLFSDY